MSEDRDKLLKIMSSLEADYRSGKISADKYSYFRSKYEDKLNTIDAEAATRKIRSMQGKPSNSTKKRKRSKKPTNRKKQEEQDLVQKYIINPKKGDAKYNRAKKSSMDSGTFKLLLLLVLVVGFTAGVAYGVFNFDFDTVSQTESVATVEDTAFPEFNEVLKTTNSTSSSDNYTDNTTSSWTSTVETTTDTSNTYSSDSGSQSDSGSNTNTQPDSGSNNGGSSQDTSTNGGN